jgi:3-phosphoshikimate 1-carboxyvinyltransferase
MDKEVQAGLLKGVIQISPSKSDAQRVMLAAALAKGTSIIHNVGNSADEIAMQSVIECIGARIQNVSPSTLRIIGIDRFPEKLALNVGESGLGARLVIPICAAHEGQYEINGEGTLCARPMKFFEEVLPVLGVSIKSKDGFLPFTVNGPMYATEIVVDGSQSSQYISGLLMALPLLKESSVLQVENLKSIPYLKMTLNTLSTFGIEIQQQDYKEFLIKGNQSYLSTEYSVEGDWSSASYWLVASALGADIYVNGLSMSSLQADKKILDAFVGAGCTIKHTDQGIAIDGNDRHTFIFDATHCPDLFPSLVLFAALTEGTSKIKGVQRLKYKESDRGEVLKKEFEKLGISIEIVEDIMLIHGKTSINGGMVDSHHDHRIAMCMGIAGLFSTSPITIQHSDAVAKSYPEFWSHLDKLEKLL